MMIHSIQRIRQRRRQRNGCFQCLAWLLGLLLWMSYVAPLTTLLSSPSGLRVVSAQTTQPWSQRQQERKQQRGPPTSTLPPVVIRNEQDEKNVPTDRQQENPDDKDGVLVVCTTDGRLYSLHAWNGESMDETAASGASSGPPLLSSWDMTAPNEPEQHEEAEEETTAHSSSQIIPGLDGRLYYWTHSDDDSSSSDHAQNQIQPLDLDIHSLLIQPVRTCSDDDDETSCGVVTATATSHLLALDGNGQLRWNQRESDDKTSAKSGAETDAQQSTDSQQHEDIPAPSTTATLVVKPSPPKTPSSTTALLQRKDYTVQQVQLGTGRQEWNVTMATFEALDFGDDGGQKSSSATAVLPDISFWDMGRTLVAVDPMTHHVLWSWQVPSTTTATDKHRRPTVTTLIASVFGMYQGSWHALHVLEEHQVVILQQQREPTGTLAQLTDSSREEAMWKQEQEGWWLPYWKLQLEQQQQQQRQGYRQRLLPAPPPSAFQTSQDSEMARMCRLTGGQHSRDCPNFEAIPLLELPAPPRAAFLPNGLLLSWNVVVAAGFVVLLIALAGRLWYIRKKKSWTVWILKQQEALLASNSSSSSQNGRGNEKQRRALRRSLSLPGFHQQQTNGGHQHSFEPDLFREPPSFDAIPRASSAEAPQPPSMGPLPLVRYSRYSSEFEELQALGKGGFGSVYRCRNVLDDREYAIKKVSIVNKGSKERKRTTSAILDFDQQLERVLREVKILAVLDHPNIVRYYTAWLEMEEEDGDETATTGKKNRPPQHEEDESAMSRCYSSSLLTEDVSEWTIGSPAKKGKRDGHFPYQSSNPLGQQNDILLSEEPSLPRRAVPRRGSLMDDIIFERSEEAESPSATIDASKSASQKGRPRRSHSASSLLSKEHDTIADAATENSSGKAVPASATRHTLYIQMQLCTLQTVNDFLRDTKARQRSSDASASSSSMVDLPKALGLLLQIAQAVAYVHEQGLIHRDLKPSNCFMDEAGTIKVGDFGLSRESSDKEEDASADDTDSNGSGLDDDADHTAGVGTRSYASPEQMSGSDYDSSTDVFSLGIMLFELCYPMYTGMERSICLSRVRRQEFPDSWDSTVGQAFPTLRELIKSMLSVNPSDRPAAAAVAHHLQSLLGEVTILSADRQKSPELVIIRVEVKHDKGVLHQTMDSIHEAARPIEVDIVEYGLRSSKSGVAIMEFALSSKAGDDSQLLQGSDLVAALKARPEVIAAMHISGTLG